MSAEEYAVTETGYRSITPGAALMPGEVRSSVIPPSLIARIRAEQMKAERSQRLRATDWTQMADAPLTALEKAACQTYRQALRDLPSLPGFPDVPWPVMPDLRNGTAGNEQEINIGE